MGVRGNLGSVAGLVRNGIPGFLVVGAAAVAGCVRNVDRPPVELHPVRGRVFLEAQPLADAVLMFHSVEPTPHPRPRARSAEGGAFEVTTFRLHDGAPAGEYRVTISCKGPYEGKSEDRETEAEELLPRIYQRPETTPLTVEVRPGENDLGVLALRRGSP